jgi:hypothetical protein
MIGTNLDRFVHLLKFSYYPFLVPPIVDQKEEAVLVEKL